MILVEAVFERLVETVGDWPWNQITIILLTAVLGFLIARVIAKLTGRQFEKKTDSTTGMIAEKIVFYTLLAVVGAIILRELDVSLGALLAAGGFLGLAVGFAAQTSVSNMISGIFLIFERPFQVGDVLRIDDKFGAVLSIDLLSTKVRTFDNLYWRIPNEKVLKSDFTTITKYDIRRLDVNASISYDDDIGTARQVLLECAQEEPLILGDPEPTVLVTKMADSGIELILRCWFYKTDFLAAQTELIHTVKERLEAAGCTIPFPHRTLYVRNEEDWQKAAALENDQADE